MDGDTYRQRNTPPSRVGVFRVRVGLSSSAKEVHCAVGEGSRMGDRHADYILRKTWQFHRKQHDRGCMSVVVGITQKKQ